MKRVIIVGAGGFGREAYYLVQAINEIKTRYEIVGFLDDNLNALDGKKIDSPIIGRIDEWIPKGDEVYVMGIASPKIKEVIANTLISKGATFITLIHPELERFVCSQNVRMKECNNAKILSGKRVVALSSGTAAVHLGLLNCGVKPGDEVIVQSFTFCASTHPVTYLGATPVLVDSEPDTWYMDPELLEVAIKDRIEKTGKTPKAIVPVALYGMPYKADRIMEIAN